MIHRSPHWVLSPSAPYERVGRRAQRGVPVRRLVGDDGILTLYYGAADTCVAAATAILDDVITYLVTCPPDGS